MPRLRVACCPCSKRTCASSLLHTRPMHVGQRCIINCIWRNKWICGANRSIALSAKESTGSTRRSALPSWRAVSNHLLAVRSWNLARKSCPCRWVRTSLEQASQAKFLSVARWQRYWEQRCRSKWHQPCSTAAFATARVSSCCFPMAWVQKLSALSTQGKNLPYWWKSSSRLVTTKTQEDRSGGVLGLPSAVARCYRSPRTLIRIAHNSCMCATTTIRCGSCSERPRMWSWKAICVTTKETHEIQEINTCH